MTRLRIALLGAVLVACGTAYSTTADVPPVVVGPADASAEASDGPVVPDGPDAPDAGTTSACGQAAGCEAGAVTACRTCATRSELNAGTAVCTATCDVDGAACAPAVAHWSADGPDPVFSHGCGSASDGIVWTANDGVASCFVQYGPFTTLTKGHYRVDFRFAGDSVGSLVLDVVTTGADGGSGGCGGSLGGLCGTTIDPHSESEAQTTVSYEFDILVECQKWEFRIFKPAADSYVSYFSTTITYLRP